MMKQRHYFYMALIISFLVSNAIAVPVLVSTGLFTSVEGNFTMIPYIRWVVPFFVIMLLFMCVVMSHKFSSGKFQEVLFVLSALLLISIILSYIVFALISCKFEFTVIDWFGSFDQMVVSWLYYLMLILVFFSIFSLYCFVINKNFISIFAKDGPSGKLKQMKDSNLENSRWMTEKEKKTIFKQYSFNSLGNVTKDGIPVKATLDPNKKDMQVMFNSPCHSIIIGSTGSGKTTTFVSPMIQILGATKAGSSMIITDPKGELFSMHSQFLQDRGYDVKVVDLRDTYSSYRWNPLDGIWDQFEEYRNAYKKAFKRVDNIFESGLVLDKNIKEDDEITEWYEFDGKAYKDYQRLVNNIKVYKKKIYDEVYEDLNDLVSVLIPVENEKDPLWEKGARAITLAVLLAMLEDSTDPANEMTKEKFNFFNLTKILQNSNKDYEDLRMYFKGRSPLSKAYSLSKQVTDAAPSTRASYMSIVYDKLVLFNDTGVCALTSTSDFTAESLAEHPTALFLKIPDEKDTRHNLAAIFILNIYKTLIKVASETPELALPRNVYFIMDEFGNMPKISKFDKFITVGRSRKIWFTMIVQSYSQLNNVYGDNVADIIKGNCGIKMFIGSNDMGTCKEYSELCGNITIQTSSTSGSAHSEKSFSTSLQTRPLIYPSELQRLNHPGDIGHSIIVTFGNYPLKTYFTPSFQVPLYKIGKMDQSDLEDQFFNENAIFYDIKKRNNALMQKAQEANEQQGFAGLKVNEGPQPGMAPAAEVKEETPATENVEETKVVEKPKKAAPKKTKAEPKATKEKKTATKASKKNKYQNLTQAELTKLYKEYKKNNPDVSFIDFCVMLANGEIKL
ncbi:MAG: type IV secretory system conjugative DNA transfer family protein [Acholeplasmatales bacterium]|nr:type IV secretory system conjugative DNA transfer family protein [Acholeplasmatales bacterium]